MSRALESILKTDPEFFTLARLRVVKQPQLEAIFDTTPAFSLLSERTRLLQELGYALQPLESFLGFVEKSDYDCTTLVHLITQNLPGFRDEALYDGPQVFFYKRAQILVADLIGAWTELGQDKFKNKQALTMFADYRAP